MKILLINKFHYLKGGSERYVFLLSDLLREKGHEVIHFSMKHPQNLACAQEEYFADFVDMHEPRLANVLKLFRNQNALKQLKRLIDAEKPDIAHLHNIAYQIGPAIIPLLKRKGIKVVMTLHDYKLFCPNAQLYNSGGDCRRCLGGHYHNCFRYACQHSSRAKSFLGMLEAYLNNSILDYYRSVDMFLAPSRFLEHLAAISGVEEKHLRFLPNFLPDEDLARQDNGPEGDYLLYFGRLSPEKGVPLLIEALAEKGIDSRAIIAGLGPSEEEMRRLVREYRLQQRVDLIGFQTGTDLKKLVARARAVIIPSLWPENMPYAVIEALAMGRIVIAARVGGLPELVRDGENGFLFEPNKPADLAAKIRKLEAMSDTERQAMQARASESALRFNKHFHYEALRGIYSCMKPDSPDYKD